MKRDDDDRLRAHMNARYNQVRWHTQCPSCGAAIVLRLTLEYGFVEDREYAVGDALAAPPDGFGYSVGEPTERYVAVHSDGFAEAGTHLATCVWRPDRVQFVVLVREQRIADVLPLDATFDFSEEAFNGVCTSGYLPCPYLVLGDDGRPLQKVARIVR